MVPSKRFVIVVLCVVMLCSWQIRLFGQQVEPEHAKLNTEDATPVDPGHFELEFAYSFTRATRQWDDHWSGENRGLMREHGFEVGLTYGVVENLDVGFGVGWADIYDRDYDADDIAGPHYGRGATDLAIGAKWRFYHNEERGLSFAYVPGLTVPTGRRSNRNHIGPSQEFWSFDQRLAMSKDWGRWTMNADLGYSLPFGSRRDDARGTLDANLAVGHQLYEWLQPELELNYAHDFVHRGGDADVVAVTGGVIMPLSESWRVETGVQHAIAGRNADQATAAMVSAIYCW